VVNPYRQGTDVDFYDKFNRSMVVDFARCVMILLIVDVASQ
jgi:hypothetical protein